MNVVWLANALQSRNEQIRYIAQDNPTAALGQLARILRRIDILEEFPKSGLYQSETDSFRLAVADTPFIALYRIRRDRIEIFRFVHGKQKPL